MHQPRRWLLAIAVALGAATAVSAQSIESVIRNAVDSKNIEDWLALVNTHRADSADAAAVDVSEWSADRLTRLTSDLVPLVRAARESQARGETRFRFRNRDFTPEIIQQLLGLTDDERARMDVNRIAKRGLVLHTDIARYIKVAGWTSRRNTLVLNDGQHAGDESSSPHWNIARSVLSLVRSSATDETVRLWYHAMTADSIRNRDWHLVVPNLDQGLRQVPDDARLLLHAGVVHEIFGSDDVQSAISLLKARGDDDIAVRSQDEELVMAEQFLRRATIADPDLAEASLRRGHVLSQFRNHDFAIEELRRAAAGTTNPTLIYYAMLLLGREEAANGRSAAAHAALDKAHELFPQAQSPLLAECQLARREEDFGRASAALKRLEALPLAGAARVDPWWVYETYAGRDADALIAAFYESYRKGDPR